MKNTPFPKMLSRNKIPFPLRTCLAVVIISCCGCLSHGKIEKTWTNYDGSEPGRSIEDFWVELKYKLNPNLVPQVEAQKQEIESLVSRLGVPPESVSYHIGDIFKDGSDNSTPFELAPDLFPSAGGQAFRCAVKTFGRDCWEHPWDVIPDRDHSPHASSLPGGFLIRYYDPSDVSHHESLRIAGLSGGRGFTLFVYIPPMQSAPARVIVVRMRVFEPNSPLDHFVRMLNPHWQIENVSGDGNCGYWAALRSLQDLQSRNDSSELRKFEAVPENFSASSPQREDYQLMNRLRQATSKEAKKEIVASNWDVLQRWLTSGLGLIRPDGSPDGCFAMPRELSLSGNQMDLFQQMASSFHELDMSLYRWDLCAQVSSGTHDSLRKLQGDERRDDILRETAPARYRYLMEEIDATALWLGAGDMQHLAQAIKLPLLVVAPREQMPASADRTDTIKDKIGCFFYDENGKTLLSGTGNSLENGNPARIAALLRQHPNTVKIVFDGTNHFLAIVEE